MKIEKSEHVYEVLKYLEHRDFTSSDELKEHIRNIVPIDGSKIKEELVSFAYSTLWIEHKNSLIEGKTVSEFKISQAGLVQLKILKAEMSEKETLKQRETLKHNINIEDYFLKKYWYLTSLFTLLLGATIGYIFKLMTGCK